MGKPVDATWWVDQMNPTHVQGTNVFNPDDDKRWDHRAIVPGPLAEKVAETLQSIEDNSASGDAMAAALLMGACYRAPAGFRWSADSADGSDGGLGGAQPPKDETPSRTLGAFVRALATQKIKAADGPLIHEVAELLLSVDRGKARALAFALADRLDPEGS